MKQIALSGKDGVDKFALVDDGDFEYLNQWKWYFNDKGYASRRFYVGEGKRKTIRIHQLIMNRSAEMRTDHHDLNKLNNQRHNLRSCTQSQNEANKNMRSDNTSGYKGVSISEKYIRARIAINKKKIHIGYFLDAVSAAKAYDAKAVELFGEFARLNFPSTT